MEANRYFKNLSYAPIIYSKKYISFAATSKQIFELK